MRIALAATFIKYGDVIFGDGFTTIISIVSHIRHLKEITIITNSLPIANLLFKYDMNFNFAGGYSVKIIIAE